MTSKPRARKKKICLIFCGGTIAMARNAKTGALEPSLTPDQLYALAPKIRDHAQVSVIFVTNKDSIDLTVADWKDVCNRIHENMGRYDAFVVTHGTDSMVHTACALAFAFGNGLQKPVIMTGSMASPMELGTDAVSNIERAIKVAIGTKRPEVMISFNDTVLRGTRTRKVSERLAAYHSPAGEPMAEHYGDEVRWRTQPPSPSQGTDAFEPYFCDNVITVVLESAMNPDHLRKTLLGTRGGGSTGLVFISLGAGYIPRACHDAIREANRQGVPVVVTSAFPGAQLNMRAYQHGLEALELGVIPAGNMTPEASSTKLKWALGVADERIRQKKLTKEKRADFIRKLFSEVRADEMTAASGNPNG